MADSVADGGMLPSLALSATGALRSDRPTPPLGAAPEYHGHNDHGGCDPRTTMDCQSAGQARPAPVVAVRGGIVDVDQERFGSGAYDEVETDDQANDRQGSSHDEVRPAEGLADFIDRI